MPNPSRPIILNIQLIGITTDEGGVIKESNHKDTFYFSIEEASQIIRVLKEEIEKAENSALTQSIEPS